MSALPWFSESLHAAAFDDALRELMSPTVTDAIEPQSSAASDPPAGAGRAERIATYRVTPDPAFVDTQFHPTYGDGVENGTHVERTERRAQAHPPQKDSPSAESVEEREAKRQARLRLWQAIR